MCAARTAQPQRACTKVSPASRVTASSFVCISGARLCLKFSLLLVAVQMLPCVESLCQSTRSLTCAVIDDIRKRGDSCGGEVTCVIRACPKGLGSPVFDKLEAELAKALMSLPASKVILQGLIDL